MASLIDVIIQPLVGWYLNQINLTDPFAAIIYICFNFLLVKIGIMIFPFIKPVLNIITMPFRFIHFYSHIQIAQQIEMEIKEEQKQKELKNGPNSKLTNEKERMIEFGVYNRFEFDDQIEGSNIYLTCNTLNDTIRVAMAPWKHALAFFIVYLAILPIAKNGGFFGLIIHLYSSIVLFYALIPSTSDYQMVLNTMLRETSIPKFCVYWIYVVFFAIFFEVTIRTKNVLFGLTMSLIYSFLYYFFLLVMIKYSQGKNELKYPILVKIPNKTVHQDTSKSKSNLYSNHSRLSKISRSSNEIEY